MRISATDGFSAYIAAPAAAQVQREHPNVAVEIVAATRRATQQRSGLDVEVVVGEPKVHRAKAIRLGDYCLGLYGARDYLAEHGTPTSIADLARYPLVYFIDSMLQVDDLDMATSFAPAMRESVTSTNVFVHVEATRAAAGIGLLPCFMADRHDDLVRVLPDEVAIRLTYWLVTRAETLRRPEVAAVVDAIQSRVTAQREVLLGRARKRAPTAVSALFGSMLCQRLCCTLVSTCGTVTVGWIVLTQSLWPMSAWAGPARPMTAAAIPLAITAANPNFFIFLPSSVALPVVLLAGLMVQTDRSGL